MRYKILELLKSTPGFVSGEDIGERFNVSRAAVWKNIARLKEEGYNIESVSNRGYRFLNDNDILNKFEIGIENCVYFDETDSTNDQAKRIAAEECDDKLLFTCGKQLHGKGRLGRTWDDKGENACMSFVFKPDIPPFEAPKLTLVAGLAIADALHSYTGLKLGIKWPNDITAGGKKICGILTEMSAEIDKINYVVVGIGINVNCTDFDGELKEKATSLALCLGHKSKRSEVIRICADYMFKYYDKFCKYGFAAFTEEYNRKCINVGKAVKAIYKSCDRTGIAKGVNDDGALIIQDGDGKLFEVTSGEVSLRLENNNYA